MLAELDGLREALQRYITAAYHISHPALIERRDRLLRGDGEIAQRPFVESSARYRASRRYAALTGLPPEVRELLTDLGTAKVLFNPPYDHQAAALERVVPSEPSERRDLVVTTGTGSGKTECFLIPILGRLAREAAQTPKRFKTRAVRALVLYPMNALVNDQLGRLRTLFGGQDLVGWFSARAGRPIKFARYTGKTLYPGPRREKDQEHRKKLEELKFYLQLEDRAAAGDQAARRLVKDLQAQGKWPCKAGGVRSWFGPERGDWAFRTIERDADPELLTRHEVQKKPPDVLVTNYSMLEYMLLRPIERGIFQTTAEYFAETDEQFVLVLDEAHLYRGVTGAEVGMLVRRLKQRLGLRDDQLTVIATSASFSQPDLAKSFVSGLTGKPAAGFEVLTGQLNAHEPSGPGTAETARALAALDLEAFLGEPPAAQGAQLQALVGGPWGALGGVQERRLRVRRVDGGATRPALQVRLVGLDAALERVEQEVCLATAERTALAGVPLSALLDASLVVGDDALDLAFDDAPGATLARLTSAGLDRSPERAPMGRVLHDLLSEVPVVGRLINETSGVTESSAGGPRLGPAKDLAGLASLIFDDEVEASDREAALRALLELGPLARGAKDQPLLAARVHAFFRGLPGLWACVNPKCPDAGDAATDAPVGRLFAQPAEQCSCGCRVYELYTCRGCGRAFFQVYADDPADPRALYAAPGGAYGSRSRLAPLTLGLECRSDFDGELARLGDLSLRAGQLAERRGPDTRLVLRPTPGRPWRPTFGRGEGGQDRKGRPHVGQFERCPHCSSGQRQRVYPIQDHATSGDDPFLEIVRRQVLSQPPRWGSEGPLKGRKALVFSDSRQVAERVAARLQRGALQDAVRPLLLEGLRALETKLADPVGLDHAYLATLIGAATRGVSPRPDGDDMFAEDLANVQRELLAPNRALRADLTSRMVEEVRSGLSLGGHDALADAITRVLLDRHTGLAALALADVRPILEAGSLEAGARGALEAPRGRSHDGALDWSRVSEDRARELLIRLWLQLMLNDGALRVPIAPASWVDNSRSGPKISRRSGAFSSVLTRLLPRGFRARQLASGAPWRAHLQGRFGTDHDGVNRLVQPSLVALDVADAHWARCAKCSRVQPILPEVDVWVSGGRSRTCLGCGGQSLEVLYPGTPAWSAFEPRKSLYRDEAARCQRDPAYAPHPLQTAAHTAGLNDSASDAATGRAEEYELRFQDVPVERPASGGRRIKEPPVDVLSVTTTMEVGIDIGSLTAVALRNVPPGRANYQQRAGRAGRRGSALSLVLTWCGADSHDRSYYAAPERMISGEVPDPKLCADNPQVIRRHLYSTLLSRFQQLRLGDSEDANVFSSLGTLSGFAEGGEESFSYRGLEAWLREEREALIGLLGEVMPEIGEDAPAELSDPIQFIEDVIDERLLRDLREQGAGPVAAPAEQVIDAATALRSEIAEQLATIDSVPARFRAAAEAGLQELRDRLAFIELAGADLPEEQGMPASEQAEREMKLLDHLFQRGLLPSYAFPTEVVAFHVFKERAKWRHEFVHRPQRSLVQALSTYAPGREVWVDKATYRAFAIYGPYQGDKKRGVPSDFKRMKDAARSYLKCRSCGFVSLTDKGEAPIGSERGCPACGEAGRQGPAQRWIRPPGFAHPVFVPADRTGAEMTPSRASSAKLSASFDGAPEQSIAGGRVQVWTDRPPLIWTNEGPEADEKPGFRLCVRCGLAEPNALEDGPWTKATRPYPSRQPACDHTSWDVVMGTQHVTDVAVLRLRVDRGQGVRLDLAGNDEVLSSATHSALKTLVSALEAAAVGLLDLEPGDIEGGYRVALTDDGQSGAEVEIYLYDSVADGAGHAHEAVSDLGRLLGEAGDRLAHCTNSECVSACYDCLCSYKNRFDHALLDRRLGLALLEHCWHHVTPALNDEDEHNLLRRLGGSLDVAGAAPLLQEAGCLRVGGATVVLAHPLRPDHAGTVAGAAAADAAQHDGGEVLFIDAWLVRRNLPLATSSALGDCGAGSTTLPAGLRPTAAEGRLPVYRLPALKSAALANITPTQRVELTDPVAKDQELFVLDLVDPDAAGRLPDDLCPGARYLLVERWADADPGAALGDKAGHSWVLVVQRVIDGAPAVMGSVRSSCAVAQLRPNQFRKSKCTVRFLSSLPEAYPTEVDRAELRVLGRVRGAVEKTTGAVRWRGE